METPRHIEEEISNLLTKYIKVALRVPPMAAVEYLYSSKEKGCLNFIAANDMARIYQTATLMQSLWSTDHFVKDISSKLLQLEAEFLQGKTCATMSITLGEIWRKRRDLHLTGNMPLSRLLIATIQQHQKKGQVVDILKESLNPLDFDMKRENMN